MAQDENDYLGILKSIWKQDPSGRWVVHDMQGIDLKPREGFSPDYFKVQDEMHLLTQHPGDIFQNIFSSFGMTEFLVRQSIVPIVAWNDGDKEMRCIGTGFFISASGLLMTAAHVLRDPVDENYTTITEVAKNTFRLDDSLRFGIMLPANPAMKNAPPFFGVPLEIREANWFVAPFEWAFHWGKEIESPLMHKKSEFQLGLDVAICKVRISPVLGGSYQPLNIGQHSLNIGDRAVAIGYAEMKNVSFDNNDDYQPELVVSVGSVTNIFPDNITERQTTTLGPCFEFDASIPGKMSGAPILVGSGILTKGVVSRSWQGERLASGCLIAPIMGLPLDRYDGKSLVDLMKQGNEGIAHIRGVL